MSDDEGAYDSIVGAMYTKSRRPTSLSAYGDNEFPYKADRGSIDVFEIDECQFECPKTHKIVFTNLLYVNPNNDQAYWYCMACHKQYPNHKELYWHFIKDPLFKYDIPDLLHDKYQKVETDLSILNCVNGQPGINHYQLCKILDLSKGRVRRSVERLKKLGLVKTRKVGKSIRVYPNTDKRKPENL